jgi:hypothetical protein
MSIEFHQTIMGRQFYDGTAPRIARSLEALVALLNKQLEADNTAEQQSEDERHLAAFVMREDIAAAIEAGFSENVHVSRASLVDAVRRMPLPSKGDVANQREALEKAKLEQGSVEVGAFLMREVIATACSSLYGENVADRIRKIPLPSDISPDKGFSKDKSVREAMLEAAIHNILAAKEL